MKKVVTVAGHVREEGLAIFKDRPDIELRLLGDADQAAVMEAMPGSHGVLVRTARITAEMIAAAPELAVVSRHGVGYDNVDLASLTRRRIPLCVSATANAVTVAEHALYAMLELAKRGRALDAAMRDGEWTARNRLITTELFGARLLIIGHGRIGSLVGALGRAFAMKVEVFDPPQGDTRIIAAGHTPAHDLDAALARSDFVTIHCPLNETTRGMIDARRLAGMKRGAFLVNTARGGIVEEAALLEALRGDRIAGAALDVFDIEPAGLDNPLLGEKAVLLSPHIAGVSDGSMLRMCSEAAANICAVFDRTIDPAVVVNPEIL